ncbi:MAG: hypothetical protein ACI4D9_06280 [Lachnospiraceae bacterium]
MRNVTGVGEADHVTANDFRNMLIGIFGLGSYILQTGDKLAPTLVSNNQMDIGSGMMCSQGNLSIEDTGASIAITNGTQGMKRIDLVVNRYTRNDASQIESNDWVYLMGTADATSPVEPEYSEGDIVAGDLIADCPVYRITINGLSVESIECLLPVIKPLTEKQNQITGGTDSPSGGEDNDVYIQFES